MKGTVGFPYYPPSWLEIIRLIINRSMLAIMLRKAKSSMCLYALCMIDQPAIFLIQKLEAIELFKYTLYACWIPTSPSRKKSNGYWSRKQSAFWLNSFACLDCRRLHQHACLGYFKKHACGLVWWLIHCWHRGIDSEVPISQLHDI